MNKNKIFIFDLDDTLLKTSAKVIINDNNDVYKLTTLEFGKKYEELSKKDNIKFNFDEFGDNPKVALEIMYKGEIICSTNYILQNNKNSKLGIITARSLDNKLLKEFIFKKFNIDIPTINIFTINNEDCYNKLKNNLKEIVKKNQLIKKLIFALNININLVQISKRKQLAMLWFLSKDIEEIFYYDDDLNNIQGIYQIKIELEKMKKKKKINLFLVINEKIIEY